MFLIIFSSLIDLLSLEKYQQSKDNWVDREQYKSVSFISQRLQPCPVTAS
jgi:hypothetical protein